MKKTHQSNAIKKVLNKTKGSLSSRLGKSLSTEFNHEEALHKAQMKQYRTDNKGK